MKKTILATTLALIGISAASANDDFKLFADKNKKKPTPKVSVKAADEPNEVVVKETVSESKYVTYVDGKAVEVSGFKPAEKATPVAETTHQEAYLKKMLSQQEKDKKAEAKKAKAVAVAPVETARADESWKDKYVNTYPDGLHMFKDNGTYKVKQYKHNGLVTTSVEDKKFYGILANIMKIEESKKKDSKKNQRKLKAYDYKVHELAEKGNENSIDYLCINPRKSPYIQVDVMKHYCSIAAAKGHVEFLGYRAWFDDRVATKVSNNTGRKQHNHLLSQTLKAQASWALLLEIQNTPSEKARQKTVDELNQKQSAHWLHADAVEYAKNTPHEVAHSH